MSHRARGPAIASNMDLKARDLGSHSAGGEPYEQAATWAHLSSQMQHQGRVPALLLPVLLAQLGTAGLCPKLG